jgi:hypothetical protein
LHLKLLLAEYGLERYQLDSEYSNRPMGMSEFLIDFLWWDRRNESQQQMVLAVESEWYNIRPGLTDASRLYAEEVAKDFYKLMVVKSPYKLMTFSSEGGASRDLIVKRLEQDVATFVGHVKGEQYVLLDSSPKDDWAAYQLLIAEDGACRAHFSKLEIRRG